MQNTWLIRAMSGRGGEKEIGMPHFDGREPWVAGGWLPVGDRTGLCVEAGRRCFGSDGATAMALRAARSGI